jgi:predicted phage-related endonuclease
MEVFYCKVEFSQEIADNIAEKVTDFWVNNVIAEVPPEPQTYEDCMLLYQYPTDEPPLEATPELLAAIQEYEGYKADARIAEAKAEALKDKIACAVGNSSLITFGGIKIATYKLQISNRLDSQLLKSEMPDLWEQYCKVSRSRVLRPTKPKKEK